MQSVRPCLTQQCQTDEAEENDADERVRRGREQNVAVATEGQVTVEQQRRNKRAANRVHDDTRPDGAGLETQLSEDDGGR